MKTILRLFVFASLACCFAAAQEPSHYVVSASTTAVTIQQPASNSTQVSLGTAAVYCASAQTATLSWNGAAATATAGTVLSIPPVHLPASATVWTGSNVGSGTTGPVYNVPAASTFLIDMSWFKMGANGTRNNVTITTNGTCTITMSWTEQ